MSDTVPLISGTRRTDSVGGDALDVLEAARTNLRDTLRIADSPAKTKDCLLAMSNHAQSCRTVSLICREGWRSLKEQQKSLMLNCGVTAALLLSVSLGVMLQRLEKNPVDDFWKDSRDYFCELFIVLNMFSVILDVACIIWSLLGVVFYDLYVLDLDDLMFVGVFFWNGMASMYLLVLSSLLLLAALAFTCLILLPGQMATAIFGITVVLSFNMMTLAAVTYRRCDAKACQEYAHKRREMINRMIEEEFQQLQSHKESPRP